MDSKEMDDLTGRIRHVVMSQDNYNAFMEASQQLKKLYNEKAQEMNDEHKKALLKAVRGMIGRNCEGPDDDFSVGFWTSEAGFLSAAELRIIADELDRLNKTEETK